MRMLTAMPGASLLLMSMAAPAGVIDAKLIGSWWGSAEIVVDWTTQRTLIVELAIGSSGAVTGRVGDANLLDGRVRTNRGPILRWLGWKTDYIITGRLDGAIIEAEDIVRAGVRMPVDAVGDRLEGGVHTTGSTTGGKARMILSARRLVLARVAAPSARR